MSGRARPSRPSPRFASRSGGEPVRALTSDVWYTLLYLRPHDHRSLAADRLEAWARPLSSQGLSRSRARSWVRRMGRWATGLESAGRTPTIGEQSEWLAARAGVSVRAEEVGERLDALVCAAPVRTAEGARTALGRLRDNGIALGLVSNVLSETARGAHRLLEEHGLSQFFGTTVLSAEHPWAKPRPEPFRAALRQLGVPPSAAVHVGDLELDVRGAERAGVRPLLYTGLHRWEPPHLREVALGVDPRVRRVHRWADVPRAVRELSG